MRASVLASGASQLVRAQVAFGRLNDRLSRFLIDKRGAACVACFHHPNRVVGTAIRTGGTSDASLIVDSDDPGINIAANRPGRAADHTNGVDTVHASVCDHQVFMLWPMAEKTGVAIVGGSTSAHAIVASGATVQIEEHRLRTVQQPIIGQEVKQSGIDLACLLRGNLFMLRIR